MKKEQKTVSIGLCITETQSNAIQKLLIDTGKAKTISSAIQYLINQAMIKGE